MDSAALALALVAGAVAAVNPCGFALLPAYLAVLVARPRDATEGRSAALGRALRFTSGMTAGFVAVFGAFGLVVAPLALSLERWLPVLTVVVGVVLLGVGGWLLAGRDLALPGVPRLRRAGHAPRASWASQAGYGVTFALASLSCTIAPFLAVTSSSLRGGSVLAVITSFLAYGLGMGAVVGVLAVGAATASATLVTRVRRAAPLVSRASGALLVVAGAYVAWYGWFELRVLAGGSVDDPVVGAAVRLQSALTRAVAGLGAPALALAAAGVVGLAVAGAAASRRRAGARTNQGRTNEEIDEEVAP